MRGAYQIPAGDWATRDSLAEVTEIYGRTEVEGSAPIQLSPADLPHVMAPHTSPVVVSPIAYVPMHRYEVPTIAAFATGSSPAVRISERLDATHRVERASCGVTAASWQRMALIAGVVGAIAIGVAVGIVVVSAGGSELEAAPVAAVHPVTRGLTVTPIEIAAPVAHRVTK